MDSNWSSIQEILQVFPFPSFRWIVFGLRLIYTANNEERNNKREDNPSDGRERS
jgi:hypothetical protein